MTGLLFMSQEHVDAMNALLADSPEVREACAEALEKPVTMGYDLTDGPNGETVHWRVTFGPTVRFSLEKSDADVLLTGDWSRMIRASLAQREGTVSDPGMLPTGDLNLLGVVAPLLEVARPVGSLPVQFPDV